jgi:hypothetical protein
MVEKTQIKYHGEGPCTAKIRDKELHEFAQGKTTSG